MSVRIVCCLTVGLCWIGGLALADEPAAPDATSLEQRLQAANEPAEPAVTSLEQRLQALEDVDQQLAEAEQQLGSATTAAARRQLKTRIRELQNTQETLLQELEQLVGPLPPAVRYESPIPLEEHLEAQQRHHEAILERDVERRLPSN